MGKHLKKAIPRHHGVGAADPQRPGAAGRLRAAGRRRGLRAPVPLPRVPRRRGPRGSQLRRPDGVARHVQQPVQETTRRSVGNHAFTGHVNPDEAAYSRFAEGCIGSLRDGMQADLLVLDAAWEPESTTEPPSYETLHYFNQAYTTPSSRIPISGQSPSYCLGRIMFFLILLLIFSLPPVLADGWDDFSNNLATDLAPFLSLFGEQITKQYLSESLTKLDYFIFAMAPIGILTAVVSAIRVCGSPTLRAFIGRAQEGGGSSEAELCSSTSRDVCELYNNGGIARVLGRPKILEVVFDGKGYNYETEETGIHTFLGYVKSQKKGSMVDGGDEGWIEEAQNTKETTKDPESASWSPSMDNKTRQEPFAPNLSLNIGIKRRSPIVFWAVAIAGFLLQTGVLAFAATATYYLRWEKNERPPESYAFPLTLIGTSLLCFGTYLCASLVGERTVERVFIRKGPNPKDMKFCWVQPGGQVIGDQTFDAFCYSPRDTAFLQKYVISQKMPRDDQPRMERATWMTVVITVAGFVLQFTGLRALHSAIPVAQLGATMIMSMARTLLRMRRLKSGDNRLEKCPDQVIGHELDWLAFHIGEEGIKRDLKLPGDGEYKFFWRFCGMVERKKQILLDPPEDNNSAKALLAYRARLASLTGSYANPVKSLSLARSFRLEMVEVRQVAQQLQRTIKSTRRFLLHTAPLQEELRLGREVYWAFNTSLSSITRGLESGNEQAQTKESPFYLLLSKLDAEDRELNDKLEAILGLWVWSLKTDPVVETKDQSGLTVSRAAEISTKRILAVDQSTISSVDRFYRWVVSQEAIFTGIGRTENELDLSDYCPGPGTIWMNSNGSDPKETSRAYRPLPSCLRSSTTTLVLEPGPQAPEFSRLFGWYALGMTLPQPQIVDTKNTPRVKVWLADTNTPLVSLCAQEIFGSFFSTILNMIEALSWPTDGSDRVARVSSDRFLQHVVQAFTESGLGDTTSAIQCIAPSFMSQFGRLPAKRALQESKKQAIDHQQHKEWNQAEEILRWAWRICNICLQSESDETYGELDPLLTDMAISLGELYRQAFICESSRSFSYSGIDWLKRQPINVPINDTRDDWAELKNTRIVIAQYYYVITNDVQHHERKPIQDERTAILSRLAQPHPMAPAPEQIVNELSMAAKENWPEILRALPQRGPELDGLDSTSRTALSYAAEAGATNAVSELLAKGACPNVRSKDDKTALFWAMDEKIIEQLLNTDTFDPDVKDIDGRTALCWVIMNALHENAGQLLRSGKFDLEEKDNLGRTPLSWAVEKGNLGVVRKLLETEKVDLNAIDKLDRTPLSWAAERGRPGRERQPRPNPLSWAAIRGEFVIVRELLDNENFDPDTKDKLGRTPLSWAAEGGFSLVVRELIDTEKVDLNSKDNLGRTPIFWAVQKGHSEVVWRLLRTEKVDLNAKDKSGMTPFVLAAESDNLQIVEQLKIAQRRAAER
ncbi:uncharacterized protein PG998_000147 [Apiospora kogelbergensis]|uniref:uncharacterized protein n=1 Tax=Apiospora kogelbergensis TaxID=1337665 RepID=UPI003130D3AC